VIDKTGQKENCSEGQSTSPAQQQDSSAFEKHFSVAEVAAMWNISIDSVRRIFEREPGVLVVGGAQKRGRKRRYRTLRIPESVVARVHLKLSLYQQ
jgi:hypothetical protein